MAVDWRARMTTEAFAHAISTFDLFWKNFCSADGGGPVDGNEGFIISEFSSVTSPG